MSRRDAVAKVVCRDHADIVAAGDEPVWDVLDEHELGARVNDLAIGSHLVRRAPRDGHHHARPLDEHRLDVGDLFRGPALGIGGGDDLDAKFVQCGGQAIDLGRHLVVLDVHDDRRGGPQASQSLTFRVGQFHVRRGRRRLTVGTRAQDGVLRKGHQDERLIRRHVRLCHRWEPPDSARARSRGDSIGRTSTQRPIFELCTTASMSATPRAPSARVGYGASASSGGGSPAAIAA